MPTDVTLPYNGLLLDRAGALRADADWVARIRRHPDTRVLAFWRDRCLTADGRPVTVDDPAAILLGVVDSAHAGANGEVAASGGSGDAGEAGGPGRNGQAGVTGGPDGAGEPAEAGRLSGVGEAGRTGAAGGPDGIGEVGESGEAGVFAADLSHLDEAAALRAAGADAATDIRAMFRGLDREEAATLAYARGMLHWARNQRYCGACGNPTDARHAGHQRVCRGCGKLQFPRIEPAVIMLVEAPGSPARCLLARHRGAAPNAFSTLAGFVEIGESFEDAVHRELAEEAGVRVTTVAYQASQAWPFPSGIMVGFRAVAESVEVAVDHDELLEARWFTRAEVLDLLAAHRADGRDRPDSIEAFLIQTWLDEEVSVGS